MEAKINPQDAHAILDGCKAIVTLYGELVREIGQLVKSSAECGLDTVDSQMIIMVLERKMAQFNEVAKDI